MTTMRIIIELWDWRSPASGAALGALIVYGAIYRGRASPRHIACLVGALVVFLMALVSPIAALARSYLFSAHMLQHMLLLLIVPLFALLSLSRLRERGGLRTPSNIGTAPLCWLCGVGAMWIWHIPVLCDGSLRSNTIFTVQTISLLLAGTAFWMPIFAPMARWRLSPPHAAIYLFTACVGCTLLGIYVTFSPVSVCPIYHHPRDPLGLLPIIRNQWHLSVGADQQLGGLLMWVPACAVYLAAIMTTMARWYRVEKPAEVMA